MAVEIARERFLANLEQVQPGLANREVTDQATCFAFKNGYVHTFNEEIACQAKSQMPKDFAGAVQSRPLLDILKKLPDKIITVHNGDGHINIKGKKRRVKIIMQPQILLPIEQVEQPDKWRSLPDEFNEAVKIVTSCVSKNASDYILTCIHIHPKYMEATDTDQLVRFRIKTKIDSPVLVKGKSIKYVADLGMNKFCQTSKWIHFRNPNGLILSCLRFEDKFKQEIGSILKEHGKPTKLPKALERTAEAAKVFSSESTDKLLRVKIENGIMRIRGVGDSGEYIEDKVIKYKGKSMSFVITPELLTEIAKRTSEVEMCEDKLRVDGEKWTYIASLSHEERAPAPTTKETYDE